MSTRRLSLLSAAILAGALLISGSRAQETPAPGPGPAAAPAPALPKVPEVRNRKGFSIKITNPLMNDFRFGKSEIEAEVKATDPGAVDKVEFFVDDKLIYIDTELPYRCVFDFGTEPRSWVLKAVAYHHEGVTVSDQVILKRVVLNYAVSVNRVILYGTAISGKNGKHYVLDLRRDDLVLEEDGIRQELVDFYREERPVTLAVISDSSGSMHAAMDTVHAAASRFVDALGPEDKALVIDFDDKVYLLQDVTANKSDLRLALTSTTALGGTALYDALDASYRKLKGIDGRKAIILLSDGDDTASRLSFRRVLDEAKINDFAIYTIGLGTNMMDLDLRHVLRSLAEETGGRAYFPDKVDELEGVYQEIAQELKSQYYISYEPTNTIWDGRWRKIRLSLPKSDGEIRTRSGYYAVRRSS